MDWRNLERAVHRNWLTFYRGLLRLRRQRIVPLVPQLTVGAALYQLFSDSALEVQWPINDGSSLVLLANLGVRTAELEHRSAADVIYQNMEP